MKLRNPKPMVTLLPYIQKIVRLIANSKGNNNNVCVSHTCMKPKTFISKYNFTLLNVFRATKGYNGINKQI